MILGKLERNPKQSTRQFQVPNYSINMINTTVRKVVFRSLALCEMQMPRLATMRMQVQAAHACMPEHCRSAASRFTGNFQNQARENHAL